MSLSDESVEHTNELQRVLDIPRRRWEFKDLEVLADRMTAVLKTPTGTMRLRPLQALALHDIWTQGGLAGMLAVGSGKTLISGLAPYMLKAQRPLLLLPAALIGKTNREFEALRAHWRIPRNIRMESYEKIGVVSGQHLLTDWQPDALILDEGHKARNRTAGRTRRISKYLRDHPDTKVVVMTGSFMNASMQDYAHLFQWALRDPPVPRIDYEVKQWANATDVDINPLVRVDPGALLQLCTPEDLRGNDEVTATRLGLQRRFIETPGVVASHAADAVDCALYVRALPYQLAPQLEKMYEDLRVRMVTPDGWDLMTGMDVWRHARELALGFHAIWSPRPPDEWRAARKKWAQFVRATLQETELYDTELQVKHACQRGELPREVYDQWMKIEPTFIVNEEAVWHDDSALEVCEQWMKKGPGVVWTDHVFWGKELARRTGAKYYRTDGKTVDGEEIEDADCSTAIIASAKSNREGRNLQGRPGWKGFSRSLITDCPTSAQDFEQRIGRFHRTGQTADEVVVDVLLGCREHAVAWLNALERARATRDTLGQPQKILTADCDGFPTMEEIDLMVGSQWNVKESAMQEFTIPGMSF